MGGKVSKPPLFEEVRPKEVTKDRSLSLYYLSVDSEKNLIRIKIQL
jgi:hypothetical protein